MHIFYFSVQHHSCPFKIKLQLLLSSLTQHGDWTHEGRHKVYSKDLGIDIYKIETVSYISFIAYSGAAKVFFSTSLKNIKYTVNYKVLA